MIAESAEVVLVRMPYGELGQPSLAMGLLKSCLDGVGVSSKILPANLWFGEQVGPALHDLIFESYSTTLLGEWTFSKALFPDYDPEDLEYLSKVERIFKLDSTTEYRYLTKNHPDLDLINTLREVRANTTAFVEYVADRVVALNPKVVGCSSTFQQHTASLALLRAVKERCPDVVTMIGGANCEERMGELTFERFDFVDFLVSGEADGFFGSMCKTIVEEGLPGLDTNYPAGVRGPADRHPEAYANRVHEGEDGAPIARLENMDRSPVPNYDDFFAALESTEALGEHLRPALPFQTARGCWWGAKNHCSFCGISRTAMKFRSKSAANVMGQMIALRDRYGINTFQGTEYIFDYKYFKTLLPQLKELNATFRFEVKANLKPEQIRSFIDAGVVEVQPGVESMNDEILERLKKGTTALLNVLLLKRGKEAGLSIYWNMLHTLPDDKEEWYEEMAEMLPMLHHLQPPAGFAQIHYDRFSPYWLKREEYGLDLSPAFGYGMAYPFPAEDLWDIAYFFETEDQRSRFLNISPESRPGLAKLWEAMNAWRTLEHKGGRPELYFTEEGGTFRVVDTRSITKGDGFELSPLAVGILEAAETGCQRNKLHAAVAQLGHDCTAVELEGELAKLEGAYVIAELSGKLLTLALRGAPVPMVFQRINKPMTELNPTLAKLRADSQLEKARVNPVLVHRLKHPMHRQPLESWLGGLSRSSTSLES